MIPKQSDKLTTDQSHGTVPITPHLFATIQSANQEDWKSLFNNLRLNLQGRVESAVDTDALLKVQGKLEYISEVETFFNKIISPR